MVVIVGMVVVAMVMMHACGDIGHVRHRGHVRHHVRGHVCYHVRGHVRHRCHVRGHGRGY